MLKTKYLGIFCSGKYAIATLMHIPELLDTFHLYLIGCPNLKEGPYCQANYFNLHIDSVTTHSKINYILCIKSSKRGELAVIWLKYA